MKIVKAILFLLLFSIGFFFLFPELSMRFMVFNFILFTLFFFPFYFWINSTKKMWIVFAILLVVSFALLFSLKNIPDKKYDLSRKDSFLAVQPQAQKVYFEWTNEFYQYDFKEKKLTKGDRTKAVEEEKNYRNISQTPIFKIYSQFSDFFMKKVMINGMSFQIVSVMFWLLTIIFISFVFSNACSLLVSYGNILFIIPFAFFIGDYFYLKPFNFFLFYGQIMLIGLLVVITMYRVRN